MIKIRFTLFLLIACLFAITACTKEEGHINTPSSSNAAVAFKVDGVSKTATSSVATIYASLNSVQIIGSTSAGEGINLSLNNFAVGTYDVITDNLLLSYSTSSTYADSYLASAGTVVITAYTSTTITGTFKFTALRTSGATTKAITEGTFNCKYIKY